MALWKDFKAFALKGNVIDLAVAVVIGAAFTKIINAVVAEIIMPLVGCVMPEGGWLGYTVGGIRIGVVLGAVIEFLIVAAVLFFVVVKAMGALARRGEHPAAVTTKKCPECLEEIPLAAHKCRACGSVQV